MLTIYILKKNINTGIDFFNFHGLNFFSFHSNCYLIVLLQHRSNSHLEFYWIIAIDLYGPYRSIFISTNILISRCKSGVCYVCPSWYVLVYLLKLPISQKKEVPVYFYIYGTYVILFEYCTYIFLIEILCKKICLKHNMYMYKTIEKQSSVLMWCIYYLIKKINCVNCVGSFTDPEKFSLWVGGLVQGLV